MNPRSVWSLRLTAGALLVALAGPGPARAAAPFADDPLLAELVQAALTGHPELQQARAAARAEAARVPQVRALPDPVVSLGVQNDGFDRLRIGTMPTSFWAFGAAQTIPWAGQRGLRARAQDLVARQSDAGVERTRLGVRAAVERAYLDLLEVRDQQRILERLEQFWIQAEGISRSRYETGESAQSDVLRAQLEHARLQQRRWALVAEERRRLAAVNRATGREADAPLATTRSLADLADPVLPDSAGALAEAEAGTPELLRARLAADAARTRGRLVQREGIPDLTVAGGIMTRGSLDPMWQASVSLPLPLWSGMRRTAERKEEGLRAESAEREAEAIALVLRERLEERRAALTALQEINRLYRTAVLIQSEATVQSALAQYRVGRVPFAAVLEALTGLLADQWGYDASLASAQRIDIATRERSLEPDGAPALPGPDAGAGAAPRAMNPTATRMSGM